MTLQELPFIPERTRKPRTQGLTMVMDKGLSLRQAEDLAESAGHIVDFVKLGFGTAYCTQNLRSKIDIYHSAGILVYLGGTLFEAFVVRDMFNEYVALNRRLRLQVVEVSDGSIKLKPSQKAHFISRLSKEFKVLSEVGSKESGILISPNRWKNMMERELEAGAWKVIAEARESGTVGIYRPGGHPHVALVRQILRRIPQEHIIWEAPQKSQQTYFIKLLGANANLGNIAPEEVVALEALRLGLRGDTFFEYLPEELRRRFVQVPTSQSTAENVAGNTTR
ncbi:MAG: phosphosulfolactate synthase [Flavobacteriales bacterium]|nr:phosphosulfolactate synthase [Flavobacteriales bacterium]MCX7767736.1 phosphosulfolactate synthase [Flavobacteriales bacterium]MDW8409369.1 phosphosulfolactate synthase [Flavobacteriales bacterium]